MALIIKGNMPKACNWFDENGKHRFCKVNAFCDCRTYTRGERPSDCPIIGEIPDEHGDLIDRDALANSIPDAEPDGFENCRNCTCMTKEEMVEIIVDAEVVLEASNE